MIISAPGRVGKGVLGAFKRGFSNHTPTPAEYADLLKLPYGVFQLTRREGMLALESHLESPHESVLFKKYPSVTKHHHAMTFLCDGLRQLVDGSSVSELALSFETEMETLHEEEHQPITLLKTTSDALPGLGIRRRRRIAACPCSLHRAAEETRSVASVGSPDGSRRLA